MSSGEMDASSMGAIAGNGDAGPSTTVKLPERLVRRAQERLEEAERRKDVKDSKSVSGENSDFFSSTFNDERATIEQMISSCPEADRIAATRTLEQAACKIQQLQKFLNDSMMFLTQYELRQAQSSLQKLQSSLAEKRDEVMPKKKFAFRSRQAGASRQAQPAPTGASEKANPDNVGATDVDSSINLQQYGFSSANSENLIKRADEINQRDVMLSHLTNCKVRLYGSPSTLHIKNVKGCQILCGPVSSSVFIDQCTGCTLALACQQLRTHNSVDTQIYLHVTSRAIIEDCQGISFAPFTWTYPGMDDDFKMSGLDKDRNNWTQVDDFNWLAAGTPSPNWTVIAESERRSCLDPSEPSSP